MLNYSKSIYMDSTSTYPTGEVFDRLTVLEDATFTTFSATWTVGDTATEVTATEITGLVAGLVVPTVIKDIALSGGKILLSRG